MRSKLYHKPNTECVICRKPMYRIPSRLHDHNTCSIACRNKWFSKDKNPKWKGGIRDRQKTRLTDRTRRILYKMRAILLKGGKCQHCGYNCCIAALEFHHLDPLDKNDEMKVLVNNKWSDIEAELEKCILLCSNCHREEHWNESPINREIVERVSAALSGQERVGEAFADPIRV